MARELKTSQPTDFPDELLGIRFTAQQGYVHETTPPNQFWASSSFSNNGHRGYKQ
jgi:hypothetical protein